MSQQVSWVSTFTNTNSYKRNHEFHRIQRTVRKRYRLSHVQEAFKGEEMIEQYHVDGYRIDLYFPEYKLAIECDEFGHRDRDLEYEIK